jgi:hypothetical protein
MTAARHLRTVIVLVAAAVGPFAAIWTVSATAAWLQRRPTTFESVKNFSDYFDHQLSQLSPALPAAREIWALDDSTTPSAPFLQDLMVSGDEVLVAGHTRVYVIKPRTGELLREIRLPPRLHGLSSIATLPDAGFVSTYSFEAGLFSLVDTRGAGVRATMKVDTALGEPILLGNRIVGNGAFATELMRTYAVTRSNGSDAVALTVAQRGGSALFPRLTKSFSRQLNVTSMAASPTGDRLALAFRWSNRINIYNSRTLQLERSVAGPVETKLSFGVATHEGETVFTLDPEATHSYADVVATDVAVLAAYSGREKRKDSATMGLASAIHAFSWDGRLIGEWILPEACQKIAFDPDAATLYALRIHPKPALLAIDASAIAKAVKMFGGKQS